jgi:hypothetical protein
MAVNKFKVTKLRDQDKAIYLMNQVGYVYQLLSDVIPVH